MAYLAMARKWRPRNFEDMVGQDHIAQTIRNAIDGKRISHAYLFTGTRGVGKTTSARILAKALNCEKGPTPVPCDACDNCKAVNAGNSMDVLEIDGASNNSVDNIRDLREQVKYAPMHGTYKIYIIDEVHMLSKPAFNALLKTLEEPPAHVVFIFATTESGKVPHTILSRVQRFDFKRISETDIRGRLEYICAREDIKPEREALEAISRKADGSMRDALSLFDQVYAYSGADLTFAAARKVLGLPRDEIFDSLLRALIDHDQKACFALVQDAHSEGVETAELLVAFGEHLRNVLFARQGVTAGALGLSEARRAQMAAQAPELRDGDIIRFAKMVSDLLAALKISAHPRLAVELGFARMAALDRMVTLSQVLGQLPGGEVTPTIPPKNGAAGSSPGPVAAASPASPPASQKFAEDPRVQEDPTGSKKKTPSESLKPAAPAVASMVSPGEPPADSAAWAEPAPAPSPLGNLFETETASLPSVESMVAVAEPPGGALPSPLPEAGPGPVSLAAAALADEAETEPDYTADPEEDPESLPMDLIVPPPPPVEEIPAITEVPVQQGAEDLCGLWPRLVMEFTAARPFVGSNLSRTRLEPEEGGLRLVFAEKSAFALFGDDADFRKGMQAFLAAKLVSSKGFALRTMLDEGAAGQGPAAGVTEAIPVPGIEGIMLREPIVKTVRDLFEGRILNY
jgi:DNA polymerase-3 subunit gamma/tau